MAWIVKPIEATFSLQIKVQQLPATKINVKTLP